MAEAVLVATGSDRPGVMDELSKFLLQCGLNIIESRSISLRGEFALLLLLRGEAPAIEVARAGVPKLEISGIAAEVRPANAAVSEASTFPYIFTATGKDQAGVLHRISHLFRALNVNIEDIQTLVSQNGSFQIRLALAVPRETPVSMLREYLSVLCNELGISGDLKEA